MTGAGNTVGAQRLSNKNELLQLVDLDLNPLNKHAALEPVLRPLVRLGKLNKTSGKTSKESGITSRQS